jgi:hypothetical protein
LSVAKDILAVLDDCTRAFTFPMLDNGYVYLAASRLSAYYAPGDWALVIEVFGFSPRAGEPDLHVHTFAAQILNRKSREDYVSDEAYAQYLENNPHNESTFFFPLSIAQSIDDGECVATSARHVLLRGKEVPLPERREYVRHDIGLSKPNRVTAFELCRYFAAVHRDDVLATPDEQRVNVHPRLNKILQLEDWEHPDVVDETKLPSGSETFRQLALVLETGKTAHYRPSSAPNTHWKNWPDGGTL